MNENEYLDFLKNAPSDHFSDEFIQFLRDNNEVVEETEEWLVIKNIKYGEDWLTAFYIRGSYYDTPQYRMYRQSWSNFIERLEALDKYADREWLIKSPHKRTVRLYHVHLIKKQ